MKAARLSQHGLIHVYPSLFWFLTRVDNQQCDVSCTPQCLIPHDSLTRPHGSKFYIITPKVLSKQVSQNILTKKVGILELSHVNIVQFLLQYFISTQKFTLFFSAERPRKTKQKETVIIDFYGEWQGYKLKSVNVFCFILL